MVGCKNKVYIVKRDPNDSEGMLKFINTHTHTNNTKLR